MAYAALALPFAVLVQANGSWPAWAYFAVAFGFGVALNRAWGLLLPLLAVVAGLLVDSLGLNTGEIRLSYWGLSLSPFAAAAMALGIAPR